MTRTRRRRWWVLFSRAVTCSSARCSHRARCLLQLHAVRKGQTNAATWLVAERRANVDAKDRQGKTAVMFAISSQNVPMLKVSLLAVPRFSSPVMLTPPRAPTKGHTQPAGVDGRRRQNLGVVSAR